jgi:hypothetical protein
VVLSKRLTPKLSSTPYLARDGALRDPSDLCRLGEASVLCHQVKKVEFVDIEGRRLQKLMHELHESIRLMNFTHKRESAMLS